MPTNEIEAVDLLLQFLDIPYFGRRRCAFRCDVQQAALFRQTGSRVLLNCSRQSGKSTITALKVVHCAVWRPGSTIVVTAQWTTLRAVMDDFPDWREQLSMILEPAWRKSAACWLSQRKPQRRRPK